MGRLASNWHSFSLPADFFVRYSNYSRPEWMHENRVNALHQITHMMYFDFTTPLGLYVRVLEKKFSKKNPRSDEKERILSGASKRDIR